MVDAGVPKERIVSLPFRKSGTKYDALAVRRYVEIRQLDSILVVTSDYHSKRAFWIFKRVMGRLPVRITVAEGKSAKPQLATAVSESIKFLYNYVTFPFLDS